MLSKYLQSFDYNIVQCRSYEEFRTNLQVYDEFLVILDESIIKTNKKILLHDISKSNEKIKFLLLINDENYIKENFLEKVDRAFFYKKPFLVEELKNKIEIILQNFDNENSKQDFKLNIPLLERTEKTKNIFDGVKKVINNNLNVLITGEPGSGKKQIVNTIKTLMKDSKYLLEFNNIDYNNDNFKKLILNKIDLKDYLVYKKKNEESYPDILYFKDIDQLSLELQTILANYLNTKKGRENFVINKKIIASTTKNMKQSLRNNNFSNELFYTMDMYNIYSVPLRERLEDIHILIKEIILDFNAKYQTNKSIENSSYDALSSYIWPGNITQLKNFINRCLNLSEEALVSKEIILNELKNEFQYAEKGFIEDWKINFSDLVARNIRGYLSFEKKINSGIYYKLLKEFEKPLIIEILNHTNNNQLLSSELLGINRNTLRKKMADYEIEIIRKATK